jgi:hypothetical protein
MAAPAKNPVSDYALVVAKDGAELGELMQTAIDEGWQPWGNPGFAVGIEHVWFQAIVKYSDTVIEQNGAAERGAN